VREEFERYMSAGSPNLKEVGIRSGEALLTVSGSWKELPLFSAGRMDHEVCSRFPETVRILTERCADATGLAFCGGGEIAFRILTPGTKLKPHTGPTNARLTCQLGVNIPLGAEPGITVADVAAKPWINGKCVVFDDSFEHYEELDEMAEGDSVVLLVHFWHPSFAHKNDPEWKVKGLQEATDMSTAPGDSTATAAKLFKPMSADSAVGADDLPPID
jgi:beta-hydroxylase